jgi:hypothetical protein
MLLVHNGITDYNWRDMTTKAEAFTICGDKLIRWLVSKSFSELKQVVHYYCGNINIFIFN